MNPELIAAKFKLYLELRKAFVYGPISDLEVSILQLLELDVHVKDILKNGGGA